MLDLRLEQQRHGQSYSDLYDGVLALKRRYGLHDVRVQPRDSLAVRRPSEREAVEELIKRFRDVPGEQQRSLPALWNSLAQLEVLIGEFADAQQDFDEVAGLVSGHSDRSEAFFNTYLAALERRDWPEALGALLRACALDREGCEPFPLNRFEPKTILSARAFGVSFLCNIRETTETVVIEALREDVLDRPASAFFREVQWLQDLDHPAILRIRDFGFAGPNETRPYLVRDHFEAETLADHVRKQGPLSPEDALAILWPVARALQAAHNRGVLHRSLNPSTILIRRLDEMPSSAPAADEHPDDEDDENDTLESDESDISEDDTADGPPRSEGDELEAGELPDEADAILDEAAENAVSRRGPIWMVKLLDTGLNLKRSVLHAVASDPVALGQTSLGRAVARSLGYAPSEVTSRPRGMVWVGPHSDIFAFGRIAWFALTGRPDQEPLPEGEREAEALAVWRGLAAQCASWTIAGRVGQLGSVLSQIDEFPGAGPIIDRAEDVMNRQQLAEYSRVLTRDPENYRARLSRGSLRSRMGDNLGALADFNAAYRVQMRDPVLYRRRGEVQQRMNNLEAALSDFTRAIELEPRNAENWMLRAAAHSQQNDHDAAIADYAEVLKTDPRDIVALFSRGNAHFSKADHEAAIADYSEVLRQDPSHLWSFGNRGKCHANRGEHEKAVADFTELLKIDFGNPRALADRATSLLALGKYNEAIADYTLAIDRSPTPGLLNDRGLAHAEHGNHTEAVTDFTRAHELQPDNAWSLMYRGNSAYELGELDRALNDLNRAIEIDPQLAVAWYNRGNIQARREQHDAAIADYTRAIELNPNSAGAYYNRANSFAELDQLDKAVADYSAALAINPNDTAAHNNRGNAHTSLGDLDAALADFDAALKLVANDPVARFNRANTYGRLGQYEQALADYAEAIRVRPDHARAYHNRGNIHYDLGERGKALADYDKAIECDPAFVRALSNRGNLHLDQGETDKALADFTRALDLDPQYAPAWQRRGRTYLERGEFDGALADLTEALRLEPRDAVTLVDRAATHRLLGDSKAALADLTAALEADPAFALTWVDRGTIHLELGKLDEAIADLSQAIERDPRLLPGYRNRARCRVLQGDYVAAIQDIETALQVSPDNTRTMNNLAWLLATCPRADLRSPERAVVLARKACEQTEWQDPGLLDTLAVALAAAGCFEEAVKWEETAIALAPSETAEGYRSRLDLFRAGRPYVEDAA